MYVNSTATHQQMAPRLNVSKASAHLETNRKIIPRNENNLNNHSSRPTIANRSRTNNNPNYYSNNQIHNEDENAPDIYKAIVLIQNLAEIFKQLPELKLRGDKQIKPGSYLRH
ncbi:hypothetical protein NPIL_279821 [Nephila pilipes]|uniref:Uncharacterized protein n=1 Tax=Nephila pilipes TaxID=299642 RepID=A0A8X6U5M0_NEPPI|nr:hypothetical protein NPIL_279821 [Nephila pilipes]